MLRHFDRYYDKIRLSGDLRYALFLVYHDRSWIPYPGNWVRQKRRPHPIYEMGKFIHPTRDRCGHDSPRRSHAKWRHSSEPEFPKHESFRGWSLLPDVRHELTLPNGRWISRHCWPIASETDPVIQSNRIVIDPDARVEKVNRVYLTSDVIK